MTRTKIGPQQIRLDEVFSVERVLESRGFSIIKQGSKSQAVLAKADWSDEEAELAYKIFDNLSLRNQLRKIVHGDSTLDTQNDVLKLINDKAFNKEIQAFSTTFEWYVGELIRRRFQAFSSSFGVEVSDVQRNSDGGTSGDYDVLSVLGDASVLYIECKSGGCKQSKILNTVQRALALHSVASIILVGEGLKEHSLRQQLCGITYPSLESSPELMRISIKGVVDSDVYQWHDCYLITANEESGQLEARLRTALRLIAARRVETGRSFGFDSAHYKATGYECKVIK